MAKDKPKIIPDESTIAVLVEEYNSLSSQEKVIKARKSELSTIIKDYAMSKGTKDDKGSFFSENETFTFGAQCKRQVTFDVEKAVNFFESKGFEDCYRLVPEIKEDAVESRLEKGDITYEQFSKITNVSTNYAVSVKAKKVIVDAQETTISAKKKPTALFKKKR